METTDFPPITDLFVDRAVPATGAAQVGPSALIALESQPKTELAKIDVKAVALSRFGEWLPSAAALVAKYKDVIFADLHTTKGYEAAKKALAEVRAPRYAAQNVSKDSKAELAAVSKAVGAEEKAVVEYLAATEKQIKDQIDAEDKRRADEKAERERQEAERKAKLEAGIATIRSYLVKAAGLSSDRIANGIKQLEGMQFGPDWADYAKKAAEARDETLAALKELHAATAQREKEAAEAEAKRIENERVAAELAEKQRQIDAQLAALKAKEATPAAEAEKVTVAGGVATSPAGITANASTGEILSMPQAQEAAPSVQAPAAAPVAEKPTISRHVATHRASPPPSAPPVSDRRLLYAGELAERFSIGQGNLGCGWLFSTSGLADLIDHIKANA